jgi:hypothetical protein
MSEPVPMRTRRTRRPPGFPSTEPTQAPPQEVLGGNLVEDAPGAAGTSDAQPRVDPQNAARGAVSGAQVGIAEPGGDRSERTRRRPTTRSTRGADERPAASPYVGAATRQVNVRILIPLINRYEGLAHELRAGEPAVRTTVTELVHAQLHRGPGTAEEARELLREWRELTREL